MAGCQQALQGLTRGAGAGLIFAIICTNGCKLARLGESAKRHASAPVGQTANIEKAASRVSPNSSDALQLVSFRPDSPQSPPDDTRWTQTGVADRALEGNREDLTKRAEVQQAPPLNLQPENASFALSVSADAAKPIGHYVTLALSSNPKVAAARHRIAALQCRIPQVRSLPDPMVQETFWPFNGNALETAGGRAANQLGVTQAIPWPEKRQAKAAIASREVQIAQSELETVRLEIAESVTLACIEIWIADEALKVVDEFGDLVAQLNEVSEAQYRSGKKSAGQQDVLRAQLEGDRLEDRAVQLLSQKRVAQADLAALLHQPRMEGLEVTGISASTSVHDRLEELIGLAASCNPGLQGLAAQIARDRERQRLACLQKYPDFQLGASWLMISDNNALSPVATGNDNFGFSVGVTLPIWRQKIAAGISEAGHQTQSTAHLLASERDTLAGRLRRLIVQVDAFSEQQRILEGRIIPRTEDALKLSLADYSGSRTSFLSVIDIYEERLLLELQRIRIEANIAGTLAQIERQVGCSTL